MNRVSILRNQIISLPYRSLLRVSGKDARMLLQGIASNDFLHNKSSFFFSTFMNPKGKIFSDSLVSISDNSDILLDIPTSHIQNVKKMIEFSLLRMEASISIVNDMDVCAMISDNNSTENKDSRFTSFSVYRQYTKKDSESSKFASAYKTFELLNGVWSGDDNIKNLPAAQTNLDLLNGASKSKGCYVGQEAYSSAIHHNKTPTRIIPIVMNMKAGEMMLSKEDVCSKIDVNEFQSTDCMQWVNQKIMEGDKEVGKILFIQPNTSVGLALCDAYQPPQQPWKTETSSLTVIQYHVC